MKRIENDCVDCGLPCAGFACKHREVTRYYCDECGDECLPNELYIHPIDGAELCKDCMLNKLDVVGF